MHSGPDATDHSAPVPSRGRRGAFAIFALTARGLQQVSTLVVTILAAGFLLPAEFGVYSLGIVFVTLIQTLTYTGFYHFVVTADGDEDAILSTTFWLIFGLATASAFVLALAAWPIAALYDAADLGPVLLLLAAIQPLAGAGAWYSAVLLRRGEVQRHVAITFAQNLAALVGGVVLLWLWQSLYALVAFRYIRVVSGTVLFAVFCAARPRRRFDRGLARRASGFSGGLYGARFLAFLSRYAGDLVLGIAFSVGEAGLYRFGARIAGGATDIVAQPMRAFALTQFGAAGRVGRPLAPVLDLFTGSLTLLTGGVAAVIVVFGADVVALFFAPAYLAGLVVAYALAARAMAAVGTVLIEPALAAANRTGAVMVFNLGFAGASVAAVVVTAPFGLAALAWGQAAVALSATLVALWMLHRTADIAVGGALRAFTLACLLIAGYGVALSVSRGWLTQALDLAGGGALAAGLVWAALLALPVLALAGRLRVFGLRAFSG